MIKRTVAILAMVMAVSASLYGAETPNILLLVGDDIGFGDQGVNRVYQFCKWEMSA